MHRICTLLYTFSKKSPKIYKIYKTGGALREYSVILLQNRSKSAFIFLDFLYTEYIIIVSHILWVTDFSIKKGQ